MKAKSCLSIIGWLVVTAFGLLLALGYAVEKQEDREYSTPPFRLELEDAELELVESRWEDTCEVGIYQLTMTLANTSNVSDVFRSYMLDAHLAGCSVYELGPAGDDYRLDQSALLPAGRSGVVQLRLEIRSEYGVLPRGEEVQLQWIDWSTEDKQTLGSVALPD